MSSTLELEAEMGRCFLEMERAKAVQQQLTQRINLIIEQLEKLKKGQDKQ
jgi:hypothetical protein